MHAWSSISVVTPLIRAATHRAIAEVCKQRRLDTSKIAFTDGFWCPFKKCESILHSCKVNVSTGWLTCSVRPDRGSGPYTNERMLAWLAPVPDNSKSILYSIIIVWLLCNFCSLTLSRIILPCKGCHESIY